MQNWKELEKVCYDISQALTLKNFNLAISFIRLANHYIEAESFISVVLSEEPLSVKVLNEALRTFVNLYPNDHQEYSGWVHSLSHFIDNLWNLRKIKWIRTLYELAFNAARKDNPNRYKYLYGHLIYCFDQYSKWFDNPAKFFITFDNLSWYKWSEYNKHIKKRINHGPFKSEQAFIKWKFLNPTFYIEWDSGRQDYLLSVSKMRADILRISKIGSTPEVHKCLVIERKLLNEQLRVLEQQSERANLSSWESECLNDAITRIEWLLGRDL